MASKPDILSDLKIAKNTYTFSMRKRYDPVAHYSVKKSAAPSPIEAIFGAQKAGSGGAGKKGQGGAPKPQSIIQTFLTVAAVSILLLIAVGALFVMNYSGSPRGQGLRPQISAPSGSDFNATYSIYVQDAHILTYGASPDARRYQPYVTVVYSSKDVSNISVFGKIYASPPSRQVFVLQYERDGADSYPDFRSSLERTLDQLGWVVNDITLSDLKSLPGGCTVIIPTGYLPAALIGQDESVPSINELASRGVSVVYIGLPFNEKVYLPDGTHADVDKRSFAKLGIRFNEANPPQSSGYFRMANPRYTASFELSDPREGMILGSVSAPQKGDGYVVFVPETIDGGWKKDGKAAGEDIAKLVADEPYRATYSSASQDLNTSLNANSSWAYKTVFFTPSQLAGGHMKLRFAITSTSGASEQLVMDQEISRFAQSDLYVEEASILPGYLGGGKVSLTARFNEDGEPCTRLNLEIVQDQKVLEKTPLEQKCTPLDGIEKPASISTRVGPGEYILRVSNDAGTRQFAGTRISVAPLEIRTITKKSDILSSFQDGKFNFTFFSRGGAVSVPYVKMSLKGAKAPSQEFRDKSTITYSIGKGLGPGNYTFVFDFGDGYVQSMDMRYVIATPFWTRPEIIALGAINIAIFAFILIYLKRPQKLLYSLDIPDFPPQSVSKISIPTSQAMAIFDQVNRAYAWDRMPLRVEEIKGGFRKINFNGRQVMIGDYNLERLLEQLEGRGLVLSELGYWAPRAWCDQTGHPMQKLVMFRYLRDLFVTNVVRFSKLGALEDCDVKIVIGNEEYYLHFHLGDDEDAIKRARRTVKKGVSWIIFKDTSSLEAFRERLHSASPAMIALKMQIDNGGIELYCLEEMPQMLKRLKVS